MTGSVGIDIDIRCNPGRISDCIIDGSNGPAGCALITVPARSVFFWLNLITVRWPTR
jgi:hypothetical protein